MSIQNDAPQPKSRRTLDATGKVVLITLLLTCINPVTLLTFLPALSSPTLAKMDAALEQLDYTLKMVPRFFSK